MKVRDSHSEVQYLIVRLYEQMSGLQLLPRVIAPQELAEVYFCLFKNISLAEAIAEMARRTDCGGTWNTPYTSAAITEISAKRRQHSVSRSSLYAGRYY